ncbi:MAG: glutamate synthase [Acidobacteria bacterium RIFCSPLOWO2_02_FULL_65_29]|nr:MAG: glutamate synthase [Acidobacteria bacterium RIFCSPLOWO2_02_FULL_65_29]
MIWAVALLVGLLVVLAVFVYDVTQRKHAILRNFPIIGHFRYWLEAVGPELRQYIVTSNNEERPFSRDQRRWVYASSKHQNNYFGFGTDNDLEQSSSYIIVKQVAFPLDSPRPGETGHDPQYRIPCAKVMGGPRGRKNAFRPASIVNTSAMSYGSLSAPAVEAINRGVKLAGCMQNTGEGGIARHHDHGGDLVWQLGTGYFGARDANGRFSMERLLAAVARLPIRAIEIKISQGAKPGLGGVLPAVKVTKEISEIRGVPMGTDCISPAAHTAFKDADSLLDFAEKIADATGLPVGLKSAVGDLGFWKDLAGLMATTGRGVDFITVDGGEGGTGAAPLVFADHVALPFKVGFSRVYRELVQQGVHAHVVFIGSGKLGFPDVGLLAMALGCDMFNVAREAMLSIGCIQAQRCHTGHCPTGVATQGQWLMRGLDPAYKAARFANYIVTLRKELLQLSHACGVAHPSLVSLDSFDILDPGLVARGARQVFGYEPEYNVKSATERAAIESLMASPHLIVQAQS